MIFDTFVELRNIEIRSLIFIKFLSSLKMLTFTMKQVEYHTRPQCLCIILTINFIRISKMTFIFSNACLSNIVICLFIKTFS